MVNSQSEISRETIKNIGKLPLALYDALYASVYLELHDSYGDQVKDLSSLAKRETESRIQKQLEKINA